MKTLKTISALVLLFALSFGIKAQNYENERLNLPGDNLNLYAVMNLFQESETIEGFERSLNAADSKINNLDLNGDNLIDYIKVVDYVDGSTHSIVMQVAINQRENQDVAVFTVYRDKYDQVQIQLIGDEYLYGKNYIIEPYYAETPNPGYAGNTQVVRSEPAVVTRTTYVEVRTWPVVRYIYTPNYVVYHSPYYWNYYPVYWNPWRPYYWDYYYGYHSHWHDHYYRHYRHSNHYYNNYYANNYYHGHRSYSTTVRTYHDNGRYRNTYSRPDLRSSGSEEGRRMYASSGRTAGRADSDLRQGTSKPRSTDVGRTATPTTGRTATPAVGRTSSPTTGRTVTPATGRKSTPAISRESTSTTGRTATPAIGRTATPKVGRSATPATGRTSTPAVGRTSEPGNNRPAVQAKSDRTESPRATSTPTVRQETGRTKVQPRESAVKPAVRTTERQRTEVSAPRQEVSRPKAQAPARSESKPAVRASESRSSRSGQAVKSSESRSSKPAGTSAQPRKSSTPASKKSNSGR